MIVGSPHMRPMVAKGPSTRSIEFKNEANTFSNEDGSLKNHHSSGVDNKLGVRHKEELPLASSVVKELPKATNKQTPTSSTPAPIS